MIPKLHAVKSPLTLIDGNSTYFSGLCTEGKGLAHLSLVLSCAVALLAHTICWHCHKVQLSFKRRRMRLHVSVASLERAVERNVTGLAGPRQHCSQSRREHKRQGGAAELLPALGNLSTHNTFPSSSPFLGCFHTKQWSAQVFTESVPIGNLGVSAKISSRHI